MAMVYGYFQNEAQARQAARRCEELGVTSAVLTSVDNPEVLPHNEIPHGMRHRERIVVRSGLIGAAVLGILGFVIWFIIPALHDKLVLAGPLLTALYGAGVGVVVGMWYGPHIHAEAADAPPAEITAHPAVERVVIVNLMDGASMVGVEELLESEGAIEVIHRAA